MIDKIDNDISVLDKYITHIQDFLYIYGFDLDTLTNARFSLLCKYLYKNCVINIPNLYMPPYDSNNLMHGGMSNNNAYNVDTLDILFNDFLEVCEYCNKIVFLKNYMNFVGMSVEVLDRLKRETEPRGNSKIVGSNFAKRVYFQCEESLVDNLTDQKTNPLKAQTILNNRYGWSTGRVITETTPERIAPSNRDDILIEFAYNEIENKM